MNVQIDKQDDERVKQVKSWDNERNALKGEEYGHFIPLNGHSGTRRGDSGGLIPL
jgi:hypothetical protein